jgi:hypothetical protein
MSMTTRKWRRAGSGLIAGAAAALLIATSAGTALAAAAPTWTVKPGGKGTAVAVGKVVLEDTKTKTTLVCSPTKKTPASSAKITTKKGTHLSGKAIASITAITFANCTGPEGLSFTVKSSHLPWALNAVSFNKKTGTTTGTITGIHSSLSGLGCSAVVDGTGAGKNNGMVKVTYVNKTHRLTVLPTGGDLHIYDVSGCLGLINNGDLSSFTSVNAVSPAQTITSP